MTPVVVAAVLAVTSGSGRSVTKAVAKHKQVFDDGRVREAVGSQISSFRDRWSPDALHGSRERLLPVREALVGLLPGGGLARGSVVEVGGAAVVSLALLLASGPSMAGSWVAVVGVADLGLVAAAELGVDLERLVLIDQPEPDRWAAVAASVIEAFDVVVASPPHRVRAADGRRLQARAREQGTVLVLVDVAAGRAGDNARSPGKAGASRLAAGLWPEAADLSLLATDPVWAGMEQGYGHLHSRQVQLTVGGRRRAARLRHARLWLPGPAGEVALVEAGAGGAFRGGRGLAPEDPVALEQVG